MFYEIRFPEEVSIKSKTTLEFDTNVLMSKNGKEYRVPNRKCRMVYDIVGDLRTENDIDRIMNLFRLVRGRSIGFRYKDWLDFHVEKQILARADGISTDFQLLKTYPNPVDGALSYLREITKPVEDTVKVYINDEETDQFEVNYSSGKISTALMPDKNALVKASFDFDVPVRFDTDRLEIRMQDRSAGEIGNLRLVEIM
ncbi:MAG: DUF2460 domain-containing protein [Rickettsiales bacterium]|jgi:uncharacterized protein (TIGR02217 family)|nr:DUF2460 domain-containing protein [Rickettsiales bacterium]